MALPNLVRVALRVSLLCPKRDTRISNWSALLLAAVVLCLIDAIASFAEIYPAHFSFNPSAVTSIGMAIATLLVASVITAKISASQNAFSSWFLSMLVAWTVVHAMTLGAEPLLDKLHINWSRWGSIEDLAIVWIAVAAVVLVLRQHEGPSWRAWVAVPVLIAAIAVPFRLTPSYESFFEPRYDDTEQPHWGLSEDLLYAQADRLKATTDAIQPAQAPTLYFVGVAPGDQNTVFQKEVHSIEAQFETKFHTLHHEAILINSHADSGTPLASRTALRAVLNRIGSVIDPNRDVLFLYLTSHGSVQHGISVSSGYLELSDISPNVLRHLLDQAGIKQRVVVISACHSGVYVPALRDPNTIIITASAADKSSFGCSDSLDYTYFGRAYFVDGLGKTSSFQDAFNIAKPLVSEREKAEGFDPSEPQIDAGSAISAYLKQVNFTDTGLCEAQTTPCAATPLPASAAGNIKLELARQLVEQLQVKTIYSGYEKGCAHRTGSSFDPNLLYARDHRTFGGISPTSQYWPEVVTIYHEYAIETCSRFKAADLSNFYTDELARTASERDLRAAIAFQNTAEAKHMVAASIEMSADLQNYATRRLAEGAGSADATAKPVLEALITKYKSNPR